MKPPQSPPALEEFLQTFFKTDPERVIRVLSHRVDININGRYLHWHKFRFHTPPDGFTPTEWWHAVRSRRRNSAKGIPLTSKNGESFEYNLVDPLPESLHNIDSLARGVVGMPVEITNPETKYRYLMRSLMDESITSSQLEGASTTREVAKEMIRQGRPPRDRSERMILNNYRTMQRIGELREEALTKDLVFEIHRIVTEGTLKNDSGAGRFRLPVEEIFIGDDEGQVFHVPPDAFSLPRRMEEMCKFANGESQNEFVHPVIRSIALHFWLAYDHPFVDGNGRTARALFYWSMLKQKYWLFEFISISEIILNAPSKYGKAFLYTESDANDLTYFILYHAEIINRAINRLHDYIKEKSESVRRLETNLRGLSVLNHRQRTLIGHALRHPGQRYSIESHRVSHGVVYQTARTDLLDLNEMGLLSKRKAGKVMYFFAYEDIEERLKNLG